MARELVVVIEWPSEETARGFYDSDAYRPFREARKAGTEGEFLLVPAEDVSGVAHIAAG